MRARRSLLLLPAAAVLLASCGSGGGADEESAEADAPSATTTSRTVGDVLDEDEGESSDDEAPTATALPAECEDRDRLSESLDRLDSKYEPVADALIDVDLPETVQMSGIDAVGDLEDEFNGNPSAEVYVTVCGAPMNGDAGRELATQLATAVAYADVNNAVEYMSLDVDVPSGSDSIETDYTLEADEFDAVMWGDEGADDQEYVWDRL